MIRKYQKEEIPTLVEIWEQASALAHPFLSEAFAKRVKNAMYEEYLPDSDTWVYEESHKVIGFISMLGNEIGGLFVLPDHHSKGVGASLLKQVSKFHKEVEVEVFDQNKIGKLFYERKGFKIISEYIMEGVNQKIIRMRKLTSADA